jgi:glycine/D-amino acid oxidase-like deaminating enzyme
VDATGDALVDRDPTLRVLARRPSGTACVALAGLDRFPDEFDTLERLGRENLDGIEATITRYGIDAEFERTGELDIAVKDWQVAELTEFAGRLAEQGTEPVLLDREQTQALVHSPTYLASRYDADGVALVHPAKLAWGLRQACVDLGVRIYEHTEVTKITSDGAGLALRCPFGSIRGRQVALATNAFSKLLRRLGNYIVPVYDYVLVTEPLSPEQQDAIGWKGRQGLADLGNQFHYYRLTADNRILWGGYDVIYHFGNRIRAELDQRLATYAALAESSPRSLSSRVCVSRTDGAESSTPAAGSPRSGVVPTVTVWPTPSVTPGSASAPAGSGPESCSTSWAAPTMSARG